jgi:hypothetical protein
MTTPAPPKFSYFDLYEPTTTPAPKAIFVNLLQISFAVLALIVVIVLCVLLVNTTTAPEIGRAHV